MQAVNVQVLDVWFSETRMRAFVKTDRLRNSDAGVAQRFQQLCQLRCHSV